MDLVLVATAIVLGLMLGSFANVVVHRVPEGQSVVRPRSRCPACGTQIAAGDNIPVLSWVRLRGRCRGCGEPISIRYPLVELAMGAVFGALAWHVGPDPLLPGLLLFGWTLVVLAVIDARTRRIPNAITYRLTPVLLVVVVGGALLAGDPSGAVRAVLGGLAAFAALLLIALLVPKGMGMGDVKLAGFIGIGLGVLGWGHVVLGLFGGFLLGGVTAIGLLLTGLRSRRDMIPFGPYLAAGALIAVLVGDPVLEAYLRGVGLA